MDFAVPLKFMLAWFLIMSVTYAVTGLLYASTYDDNLPDIDEPPKGIFEIIRDGIGWIFDLFISLFRVFFFLFPNVHPTVILALNLIVQPFNLIFIIGLYPIISDVVTKIIALAEAIIPDWL